MLCLYSIEYSVIFVIVSKCQVFLSDMPLTLWKPCMAHFFSLLELYIIIAGSFLITSSVLYCIFISFPGAHILDISFLFEAGSNNEIIMKMKGKYKAINVKLCQLGGPHTHYVDVFEQLVICVRPYTNVDIWKGLNFVVLGDMWLAMTFLLFRGFLVKAFRIIILDSHTRISNSLHFLNKKTNS